MKMKLFFSLAIFTVSLNGADVKMKPHWSYGYLGLTRSNCANSPHVTRTTPQDTSPLATPHHRRSRSDDTGALVVRESVGSKQDTSKGITPGQLAVVASKLRASQAELEL